MTFSKLVYETGKYLSRHIAAKSGAEQDGYDEGLGMAIRMKSVEEFEAAISERQDPSNAWKYASEDPVRFKAATAMLMGILDVLYCNHKDRSPVTMLALEIYQKLNDKGEKDAR